MIKQSQAFATHRQATIAELQQLIHNDSIPAFNAEAEDIRRQHTEQSRNPKVGEAVADWKKRARIADLVMRRNTFLQQLKSRLHAAQEERIAAYKGTCEEETENGKTFIVAKFPDGSKAKVARNLFIQYQQYERI